MAASHELVVVTMTRATSRRDQEVLHASLSELSRTGLRVAVIDAGSPAGFVSSLQRLSGFEVNVVTGTPTLVAQISEAIARALAWRPWRVLYTEPDKELFFKSGLRHFLEAARSKSSALVVAARTADAFSTFPPVQRQTEILFNTMCGSAMGFTTDYCYGPFLAEPHLFESVRELTPEIGWGWRPYVFAKAHRLAGGISAVTGAFQCPQRQRHEGPADRDHRLHQLSENMEGLLRGLRSAGGGRSRVPRPKGER